MFWLILFIVLAVIFTFFIFDGDDDFAGLTFIFMICVGIAVFVGHAVQYTDKYNLRKQEQLLPIKIEQREKLISLVEDELTPEQYQAMLSVDNPENVVLIFKDNGASQILITRVTSIVEFNQQIFSLENDIRNLRIDICNNQDNIFVPRFFSWGLPDCNYKFISND